MPSRADAGESDAFRLVTVRPSSPPVGCVGSGWLVYEICQGSNRIMGYRRGTVPDVTADVEKIVVGLNERRGRVAKQAPSPAARAEAGAATASVVRIATDAPAANAAQAATAAQAPPPRESPA